MHICIYAYVCMYACLYVCMYVSIYACKIGRRHILHFEDMCECVYKGRNKHCALPVANSYTLLHTDHVSLYVVIINVNNAK